MFFTLMLNFNYNNVQQTTHNRFFKLNDNDGPIGYF